MSLNELSLLIAQSETRDKKDLTAKPLKQQLTLRDILFFTESLARLLQGGVPILQALESLHAATKSKKIRLVLTRLLESLRQGAGFSEALQNTGAVPAFFFQIVYAGEISGSLSQVLEELARYLTKEEALKNKIGEAVAYPVFLLFMGLSTLGVLLQVVIPKLARIYRDFGADLPAITKLILGLSHFFLPVLALFFVVVSLSIFLFFKQKQNFMNIFYTLPVIRSFLGILTLIQFARLLSLLLQNGISIVPALEITEKTFAITVPKKEIGRIKNRLQQGDCFSDCIQDIFWMDSLSKMLLMSGEKAGKLAESLDHVAKDSATRLEAKIQIAVKLLEPGLILTIGIVVGVIVVGTVLPIFDISGVLQ